ncbi:peptidoglycan-binding protein [Kitasatospora sp. NPDC059327]|uniref:peptidoglycan-binding domain-containing protein n=1 Tax=Kitasatospora sp. NPDC059327 TaxID=3346803 RepID=UPI003698E454
MTDAQLQALLPSESLGQSAVDELTRRYGDVILACVLGLSATPDDARDLSAAALTRTVDSYGRGATPGPSWIVSLLGEARYLAARAAERGERDALSPGFLAWLDELAGTHGGHRAALAAAEEESPLLRSLATLADAQVAQLWRGLVPLPGSDTPSVLDRQALGDAYVRLFVATVPERRCRHLAVPLSASAGNDAPAAGDLTRHLARCARCGRVLADLEAVYCWDVGFLRRRLLIQFDPESTAAGPDRAGPPTPAVPPPAGSADPEPAEPPGRVSRRRRAVGGLPPRLRRWGVVTVAGAVVVVLVSGLSWGPGEDQVADPPAPGTPTAPETPLPSPSPAAESPTVTAPPPLPTPTPTVSESSRATEPPAVPPPTPSRGLPVPTPSVTSRAATPTSTPTSVPTPAVRPLHRGDEGPEVVRMQDLLIRVNCVPLNVPYANGGFDDATAGFLKNFQRAEGIRGEERDRTEYGPQSRRALEGAGDRDVCGSS